MTVESSTEKEKKVMARENALWKLNEFLHLHKMKLYDLSKYFDKGELDGLMEAYGMLLNTTKTINPEKLNEDYSLENHIIKKWEKEKWQKLQEKNAGTNSQNSSE